MDGRSRFLLVVAVAQALVGAATVTTAGSGPTVLDSTSPTTTTTTGTTTAKVGNSETAGVSVGPQAGRPIHGTSGPTATAPGSTSTPSPSSTTVNGGPTTTTTTGPTTTTTGSNGAPGCPNPKTCDHYRLTDGPGSKGWRMVDGRVTIRFYINATPPVGSSITEDQIEAGILRALAVFHAAHPVLRFDYQGRTKDEPLPGDGVTVFAFGTDTKTRRDAAGYINEADTTRDPAMVSDGWVSSPCEQRDGACSGIGGNLYVVEEALTHEPFHGLGAGDLYDESDKEMTMYSWLGKPGERNKQTLAYGEVKFLRDLYPCACPLPPIYAP